MLVFPLASVAEIVIVLEPTSLQSNEEALNDTVGEDVQLSETELTTSLTVILA